MTLPLDNITILDLSRMLPGPYCTMILSDLGAEVIRVEDPTYPYSDLPPFFQKGKYRESAFKNLITLNRNKLKEVRKYILKILINRICVKYALFSK